MWDAPARDQWPSSESVLQVGRWSSPTNTHRVRAYKFWSNLEAIDKSAPFSSSRIGYPGTMTSFSANDKAQKVAAPLERLRHTHWVFHGSIRLGFGGLVWFFVVFCCFFFISAIGHATAPRSVTHDRAVSGGRRATLPRLVRFFLFCSPIVSFLLLVVVVLALFFRRGNAAWPIER